MRNISDLVILITGATDGLGAKVAGDLAAKGAAVLLHGRNPEKGQRALAQLREKSGNGRLRYYNADLSSLGEVEALALSVLRDTPRLDVLVNNAGLGAGPEPRRRETSADGYELRLAVNYLSHFLLTHRLLPLLRETAAKVGEARIVNVASAAQEEIDFDDLMLEKGYGGMRAYSQSKLAMIMFSFDLAAELAGTGVTVNALHPASLMDTNMVREWFGTARTTVDEGARYLERLVLSNDVKDVTGAYFDQGRPTRALEQAYDLPARKRLQDLSRKLCHLTG